MAAAIVFYVSGHGFGHASRTIEVINAVLARRPETRVGVRTSAPRWLFDLTVKGKVAFSTLECDTGVVQIDALTLDEADTIGPLVSVLLARQVPLSFFGTGQNVPVDLHRVTPPVLADWLMGEMVQGAVA